MRILILTNLFPPHAIGGYEIACQAVAVALRDRGHEVEVLASHAPVDPADDPPWLHRAFVMRAHGPLQPRTSELADDQNFESGCSQYGNTAMLVAHLRRFRPDVVYVWNVYGVGGLALLDVLEMAGVPRLIHLMDDVPRYLTHGIAPIVASLFGMRDLDVFARSRVIAMSEHLLAEIRQTTGLQFDTPPDIIPGWVDSRGLGLRGTYRRDGQLRLVAVGALGEHKGTGIIIDACERLLADGASGFHIDIYGFGSAAPWVARAAQQGVGTHVRFLGPRSHNEIMSLLPEYDAFLFPTWEREPFGIAPIEAAACGAVPIITRNAGVAERLVDDVHCLKIDRSAHSLANAIRKLLSGEADVERIGRRAAQTRASRSRFRHMHGPDRSCAKQCRARLEAGQAR